MGTPLTGHHRLIYPSKYLAAPDLRGRDVNVIIDRLEWETLKMAGGKTDTKVCVHMKSPKTGKPTGKSWPVGKTVLGQIAQATGETDVARWSGKLITIFPTTCRGPKGDMVECVRVRVRVNTTAEEPNETIMAAPSPTPLVFDEDDDTEADAIGLRDGSAASTSTVATVDAPLCTTPGCGSTTGRRYDGVCAPCYDRAEAASRARPLPSTAAFVAAGLAAEDRAADAVAARPAADPVAVADPPSTPPVLSADVDTHALDCLVAALEAAGGKLTAHEASPTIREGLGMKKLHVTRRAAIVALGVARGLFIVTGDGDAAVIERVRAATVTATVPATEAPAEPSKPAAKAGDDEVW